MSRPRKFESKPRQVEVPAIAVLGNDRIVHIDENGDGPEQDVDWTVEHRAERTCLEHGRRHLDVDYKEPDGAVGHHTFDDPIHTQVVIERAGLTVGVEVAA